MKRKGSTIVALSGRAYTTALLLVALCLSGCASTLGQQLQPFQRIAYRLTTANPASHLFAVTIEAEVPQGVPPAFVDLQMPLWQPGRYAVADFAKNVQEFRAKAGARTLTWTKIDTQTWRVQTEGNRTLTVSYKVFGDDLSGTFAQLDITHANYNGGEIFMYLVGHKQDPVELRIDPPQGWRVINGASARANQLEWKHPNYETLIDSPTEIGPDWTLDEFTVEGKTYRVVVHSRGEEDGRRPALVRDIERIVRVETAMWGRPEFDHYTFLIHFAADDHSSDGMEHLTSTQIIEPGALADSGMYEDTLRTAAHEFFHAWNVKRLRPSELGPWDWTKPAATKSLWIAEGFTNYYGYMMMRRANLKNDAETIQNTARTISDIENSPGAGLMSAEASSMAAPFLDGAAHRQRTNLPNTSVSYYSKGQLIATVLDLMIRGKSRGQHSLDDVMRRAYEEFYLNSPSASYYLKGRGYSGDEFAHVVSEVAGWDVRDFFSRYIRGTESLPYDEAFAYAGLKLVKRPARQPHTAGIVIDQADRNLRLGTIHSNSDAERAGLQRGDLLVAIGGTPVARDSWRSVLNQHGNGDRVAVTVQRFHKTVEVVVQLTGPDLFEYSLEELPGATAEARALRTAWLTGK
jgi:predicted metalloprotease with PDZ domain